MNWACVVVNIFCFACCLSADSVECLELFCMYQAPLDNTQYNAGFEHTLLHAHDHHCPMSVAIRGICTAQGASVPFVTLCSLSGCSERQAEYTATAAASVWLMEVACRAQRTPPHHRLEFVLVANIANIAYRAT